MKEEDDPAWKEYIKRISAMMDDGVVVCQYCDRTLIIEEVVSHLYKIHKRAAKETKKLVKARMDWERKANHINDGLVKKLV